MRTLAIGDIHGCLTALKTLVEFVDLKQEDTLITLGDYVDRGPDSKGVVDYLISLKERFRCINIKGNHEEIMEMACETRADRLMWNNVGGIATLLSYDVTNPADFPAEHWNFFDSCKMYYETDTHIFVHGGLNPQLSLEEQDEDDILWLRFEQLQAHQSGKTIVCGHTPQRDHRPLNIGYAICIDTHAFLDGWLTCFDVESGKYWQANEFGETRSF